MEIEIQKLLDTVNKKYPPNTIPLKYKKADGVQYEAKVRYPAEMLESGMTVVWLEGECNAIELKNLIL